MQMNRYIQDWLPQDEVLLPFYKELDEFLKDELKIPNDFETEMLQAKIIADPLLGYIHFSALEVFIIDAPLYQRLRNIKQLGLANLVFPSLNYSRFEHSLGVVGRINQIINKIKENNLRVNDSNRVDIDREIKKYTVSLRLAGLLHDVGHCLYSHCSERVINNLPGTLNHPSSKKISEIFAKHFSSPKKIPFAEIFTIAILGSRRFLNFIKRTDIYTETFFKRYLNWSANFILGLPADSDSSSVFLGQIMSSGLDADKIDYMTREQHYSGIRLEIDLDRILSKLQVFSIKPYQVPKQLVHLNKSFNSESEFKILGFAKGGQFSFEEFCIARLALHVKIYLHQKVRAAEAQIGKYLEFLSRMEHFKTPTHWLRLPEDIINYPEIILEEVNAQLDLFHEQDVDISFDPKSFYEIKHRKLFLRAFAFGPMNSFSEGFEKANFDLLEKHAVDDYFKLFEVENLKNEIISEAKKISELLDIDVDVSRIEEIIIDLPRLINIQQGQESLHFERTTLSPIKWTIPIDKIMVYFQENRALAYIYAPREIAFLISLASETVILNLYGKVFNQDSSISQNVYRKYKDFKEILTKKNYYIKSPEIKGVSTVLLSAASAEKIKNIYENLASFKSIMNDERITINRITTFLNQFPLDLQESALKMLTHLKVYNESLLANELRKTLNKIGPLDKLGVTSLGGNTDSGKKLGYYLPHVLDEYNIIVSDALNDKLIMKSDKILIFDDNINSGMQLYNIFGELLDAKDKIDPTDLLNEKHLEPLKSDEAKEHFKEIDIYFIYIVGFEGVENRVKDKLSQYFGFDKEKIHFSINTLLQNDKKIFTGKDSDFDDSNRKKLRHYFEKTGETLLKNEGKSQSKIDSCKIGYAGAESMVIFPYNVPTMTITALWCRGILDNGVPWIPLAERRRRKTKNNKYLGED